MKFLISIFLLLAPASTNLVETIRIQYPNASASAQNSTQLAESLASISKSDEPTLVAYKGASLAIESKFISNFSTKTTKLKTGVDLIEYAVLNDSSNIEIRFIRLSIQENLPAIVNYNRNKKEDKIFIVNNLNSQQLPLREYLKNFIKNSKSLSAKEVQQLCN